MNEKKDYKDTLLMPKTDFEMRAGLINKEPEYREMWNKNKIYEKALKANEGNPKFILHDGPPYANGSIHVGHAMNKILKDFVVRYKTMAGFYSPYAPGWDTHGLPIENKMLSEMKMSKDDLDPLALRKEASKYADTQVANQLKQFQSLQLFSDLKTKYLTKDKDFEVGQLELFKKMYLDGLVYKGLKPVYWSPSSQSALAEAEVEYEDIRGPQVIVTFKITKGNEFVSSQDMLTIMTTTPWTLIANSGVAVGKEIEYSLVKVGNNNFVVASKLLENVATLAKWEEYKVVSVFLGDKLNGISYQRPIKEELEAPVILGHHVTDDAGTGLVHMAPLFGEDDYLIGKENGLEMIMHMNDDGTLNKEADKYEGLFYQDANKDIGMYMDSKGALLSLKFVKHSYPHDWRTHKPIVFRGTPQWFVSIKTIKEEIMKELSKVPSHPNWGTQRLLKMIEQRDEWTISRQRTWGVPIIVFYDAEENIVANEEIFDYVIDLVSKNGTDIWWEKDTDDLLPENYRNKGFTREMNIMDVWFDSGSSHIWMEKLYGVKQADLYLEGSDQYRGWFNSSLINSIAYKGVSPYKTLVSHGFVLDGKNQKMSKSKGNVVDPLKIISKQGADILRLWVANAEYTSDVTISDSILKQTSDMYRKIRNTLRFMLGNLNDFKGENRVELKGIHAWVNEKLGNLMFTVFRNYNEFKFSNVVKSINLFLVEMSGFYFDFAKDILYCDLMNDVERRSIQTNMWNIANFVIKSLAPILPTSMEDAYSNLPKKNKKESVHLERINIATGCQMNKRQTDWEKFFKLKDEVYKVIEEAKTSKTIKRANEAFITISNEYKELESLDLTRMFMVGKIAFGEKTTAETFDSLKCIRCWNHFEKLNNDICTRCENVLKKISN